MTKLHPDFLILEKEKSMQAWRILLLLIISLFMVSAAPRCAMADKIFLQNGDRITGKISGTNEDGVLNFQTVYGQFMSIPLTEVMAIKRNGEKKEIIASPAPSITTPAPTFETVIEEQPAAEPAIELPDSTTNKLPEIEPAAGEKIAKTDPEKNDMEWSGRANAGATLQDGNSNKKSVSFDAQTSVRYDKNRFKAGGEINWAKDEGLETENDRMVFGEYDRFITEKWFTGARISFKTDEMQSLDLRSKYGLFAGYQFFDTKTLKLQAKAGADYISEDFENAPSEDDIAASWALDYEQSLLEETLTIFHNHDISIPMDDADAFLFESKSGLRIPIGQSLIGTLEVDFDWDNDPAPGVNEDDTSYIFKIGYEW